MINREELEICKRRGHDGHPYGEGWVQCQWCGLWRRIVIEQREDDPPEEEWQPLFRADRRAERRKQEPPARAN